MHQFNTEWHIREIQKIIQMLLSAQLSLVSVKYNSQRTRTHTLKLLIVPLLFPPFPFMAKSQYVRTKRDFRL